MSREGHQDAVLGEIEHRLSRGNIGIPLLSRRSQRDDEKERQY
jgi:hypothetical protein